MSLAYYNEIDPFAVEWLKNLIESGVIAPGHVDNRSIEDVKPDDLRGYTQCHFFAGIGVWSYALRLAGVPDSRRIWTASCPCQPFSTAGKGAGFDDERHLWPSLLWLIQQCKPAAIIGEQVASKDAEPWIDLVHADLEALEYAFGCVPFPSAGVGAPMLRDRAYWAAHSNSLGLSGVRGGGETGATEHSKNVLMGHARSERLAGRIHQGQGTPGARPGSGVTRPAGLSGGMGNPKSERREKAGTTGRGHSQWPADASSACGTGPTNGFWRAADWLHCRDGKWRPVEPGTLPLVNGPTRGMGSVQPQLARLYGRNRAGRLKGYGNAINAEAAKVFIQSAIEVIDCGT